MSFAIYLLPAIQLGPDRERLGQVTIGKFTEKFSCHPPTGTVEQMENTWQDQLRALVGGERMAILMHDPRFAWVVYREGDNCLVQQILSVDESFRDIHPRQVRNEDGQEISEWPTTVTEISDFLNRCYTSGKSRG